MGFLFESLFEKVGEFGDILIMVDFGLKYCE